MTAFDLVDPELRAALALLPDFSSVTLETLPQFRNSMAELPPPEPPPENVLVKHLAIPGPQGAPDIQALLYTFADEAPPRPALLHIHGGGFVFGSAARDNSSMQKLAGDTGCVILSIDYRLAPETPYPGALEDGYAALAWLHAHAEAIGADPARIGVRGNSAGGGLAASLALLARDRGEIPLAFQLLLYPMLDDRTVSHPFAGRHVWTPAANRFGWQSLLGQPPGGDAISHYAAPARAPDLSGLPPCFIAVGALDLFIDENIDYAKRLIRAGVPTELKVYPGAYHGFNLVPGSRLAAACEQDIRNALTLGLCCAKTTTIKPI